MTMIREAYVGIDVAKLRNAIAIADSGREGEIRYIGEVDASAESMKRVIGRLAAKYERLHFCYEAGPTGYGLHRLITELGHSCMVVAPSLILSAASRPSLRATIPRSGKRRCTPRDTKRLLVFILFPFLRCEAAPVRCFPGPRERWG
jgi:hypothetical protein